VKARDVAQRSSHRVWIPGSEHDTSLSQGSAGGWLLCDCCEGFAPSPVGVEDALRDPDADDAPPGLKWPEVEAINHDSDCPVGVMLEQAAELEQLRAKLGRTEAGAPREPDPIDSLGLSSEVADCLRRIRAEVEGSWRDEVEHLKAKLARVASDAVAVAEMARRLESQNADTHAGLAYAWSAAQVERLARNSRAALDDDAAADNTKPEKREDA